MSHNVWVNAPYLFLSENFESSELFDQFKHYKIS